MIRSAEYGIVRTPGFQIWPLIQRKIRRVQIARTVIAGDLHSEGRSAVDGRNVVHLPSFEKGADHTARVLRERQIVGPVECQIVLHMKRREAAVVRPIIEICHVLNVVAEILRIDSTGIVDRSRERVRCLRAEPSRKSFDGAHLKRVIKRLGIGHALPDTNEVWIPSSELRLEDLRTIDHDPGSQIDVPHPNQVIAAGSGVTDREIPVPRQLPLNRQVVLHDVRSFQIKTHDLQLRLHCVWIEVRDNVWKWGIREGGSCGERRIQAAGKEVVLGQNLIEEYSETGTYRCLSSLEWIPHEAYARRKILQRRIV